MTTAAVPTNLTVTRNFLSRTGVIWLSRPGDPNEVRHRGRQGIETVRLMEEERREGGWVTVRANEGRRKRNIYIYIYIYMDETTRGGGTLFRSFIRGSADS